MEEEEETTPQIDYSGLFGEKKEDALKASDLKDRWRETFNQEEEEALKPEDYFRAWLSSNAMKFPLMHADLNYDNLVICGNEPDITVSLDISRAIARWSAHRKQLVRYIFVAQNFDSAVQFDEFADKWRKEIGGESSLTNITSNINYLRIISLGKSVVPLIIEQLKLKPEPWFVALRAITGELNVGKEHPGNFRKIAQCWIEWFNKSEYSS